MKWGHSAVQRLEYWFQLSDPIERSLEREEFRAACEGIAAHYGRAVVYAEDVDLLVKFTAYSEKSSYFNGRFVR